jgi:hypothetical protein
MVTMQGKMRVTHQFRNVMRIFILSFNTHTHTPVVSMDYKLQSLPLKEVFKLQASGNTVHELKQIKNIRV